MKHSIKYPILIASAFIFILVTNSLLDKHLTYNYYNNIQNVANPIREELKQHEFLSDEAYAQTFVLNIWATWCNPCQKEIPELNALLEKYENEYTLFLAITDEKEKEVQDWMDLQKNEPEYFQFYEGRRLMNYLYSLNPDLTIKKGRYPELLPTNIIIDKGKVVYFKQGYSAENMAKMDSVLNAIFN